MPKNAQNFDCDNYFDTLPRIMMKESQLINYIVPHARNHLQNSLWKKIKILHQYKHKALSMKAPQNGTKTIEEAIREVDIFKSYRRGILDIEDFFNKQSRKFIDKLKLDLKQLRKKTNNTNGQHDQKNNNNLHYQFMELFLNQMKDFDREFNNELERIIPIIFPVLNRNEFYHGGIFEY